MPAPSQSPEARARLDELRRRLYRDGATDEDRQRYAEARAALAVEEGDEAGPDPPTRVRRRRPLLVGGAVALVLVGSLAIASATRSAHPAPVTTPTPIGPTAPRPEFTLAPAPPPQDIGDGRTLVQDAAVVTDPTAHVDIDGTGADAEQFDGAGNAVVPLDLSAVPSDGGRLMVVLTSTEPIPIAWRALRLMTRRDWTPYQEVLAEGTVDDLGVPAKPIFLHYDGAPPSRIAIEAPLGLRWTLLVAFVPNAAAAKGR